MTSEASTKKRRPGLFSASRIRRALALRSSRTDPASNTRYTSHSAPCMTPR